MTINKQSGIIGLFFALVAVSSSAQTQSYSLKEAQEYAVANAYSIRTNALEVQRSQKVIWENIARGLPQVSASGNFVDNIALMSNFIDFGGQPQLLTFGTKYNSTGTINVDQLIFDGSYIVGLMAAKVVKLTAENDLEKSYIDIREDVAQAYHFSLITAKSLEVVRENLKYIRQNLAETRELFDAGFVEQQDVDQLDLLVTNLETNEMNMLQQNEIAMTLLKLNMGLPVNTKIELSDDLNQLLVFTETGSEISNEKFTVEQDIDYRILLANMEASKLQLRNEQVQYLPRLSAYYQYNHQFISSDFNVFDASGNNAFNYTFQSWGLRLNWTLFTSGMRYAKTQQARINFDKMAIAETQMKDAKQLEYLQAKTNYEFALNSYFAQQKNNKIAKDIRDKTATKLKEGIASSLEFTQAENQYQQSLTSLLQSANSVLDKKVALEKILGKYNTTTNASN